MKWETAKEENVEENVVPIWENKERKKYFQNIKTSFIKV